MGPTRTRGTTESDRHLAGNAVLAVIVAVLAGCSSPPPKVAQHCPQPRFTGSAPEEYLNRSNPLRQERGAAAEGARLFGKVAGCAACHAARIARTSGQRSAFW